MLSVYAGQCGGLTQVPGGSNDDAGGNCGQQSRVIFQGIPGVTYRVRVAGHLGVTGWFDIRATQVATLPPNDDCASTFWVTIGSPAVCGTTACATRSLAGSLYPTPCGASVNSPDVWYRFMPTCSGLVTMDTCGTCPGQGLFDTVLSVYTGSCGLLTQVGDACNDDSCGPLSRQSRVVFNAVAGVNYRVRVSGSDYDSGPFRLNISQVVAPPPNDLCANATPIMAGTYAFNTCGANTDGPSQAGCQPNHDVWFRYLASCSDPVSLSTCGSGFDTVLAVYSGSCASLSPIDCNENAIAGPCDGSTQSYLTFNALANTEYSIRVGGAGTATGWGVLTLSGPATGGCPPNSGVFMSRLFWVSGAPNNTSWAWSLTAPCCANVENLHVPGIPAGDANTLAAVFAASINTACPGGGLSARVHPSATTKGLFSIYVRCATGTPFVFRVGPSGTPAQNQCVVFGSHLPTTGPCSFNPDMDEIPLSNQDLNGNGVDDTIDILTGASADANGNGVPDEAEDCFGPQLTGKPEPQVIQLGDTVSLSVQVEGTEPFVYQWSRDGLPLSDAPGIFGATSNVLTLLSVTLGELGAYSVAISNACGAVATAPATVGLELPTQPVLSDVAYSEGNFQFSLETEAGAIYVVEYKNYLTDNSWTILTTLVGDGLTRVIQDFVALPSMRFYRVRMP